jgi:predicted dienelactone hydrolase
MLKKFKYSIGLGIFAGLLNILPVRAANEVMLTYGPIKLSLNVSSLASYAKDGSVDQNLAFYLNRLTPEQRAEFRTVLTQKIALDPVITSRFLNSNIGEAILDKIGHGITIEGGINGKYAIRGALVQAAFEPGGLTFLGFLEKFPTNLQIRGELLLDSYQDSLTIKNLQDLINQKMGELTDIEANSNKSPADFAKLQDLTNPGSYKFTKEVWQLNDAKRNRQFRVLVYKPTTYLPGQTPVVVISHGLSSSPEDFSDKAEFLASYGFVVALPQHYGSDSQYLQDMLAGYHKDVFALDEFINRPLDVSYVIDELERRNQSEFAGKLNLKEVGAIGHSFGGYTVLSLAGAKVDFENLQKDCAEEYSLLNVSMLLSCRALDLPRKDYHLKDERIKAVVALNPVNRSIFGPNGISKITIPVMLVSGSNDHITPAVYEQMPPFIWLHTNDKYWANEGGGTHVDFSKVDSQITSSIEAIGILQVPDSTAIDKIFNTLALIFNEVYIAKDKEYVPFLNASYAKYLGTKGLKVDFVSGHSDNPLEETSKKYQIENQL